jgi:uncharacterized protein
MRVQLADPAPITPSLKPKGAKRPYLERLVINVTHDCNLRCTYCYADTGAYGEARHKLTKGVGEEIVETFFSRFTEIRTIQLFGGEPFLNLAGIDGLCRHVAKVAGREGAPMPRFTTVSNGTLVNDAVIDLINTHGILVTVSLDGDKKVNDAQRVYAHGGGSYDRVIANIRRLKAATGQPAQIEGTFTAAHLEADVSLAEFMRFIARDLGVRFLHMPWILGEAYGGTGIVPTDANIERLIAIYSEAISASFASLETQDLGDTILLSSVDTALRGELSPAQDRRTHICPAGSGTLSVGADGRVFPCFMFTNKSPFEFTRVGAGFDDAVFDARRADFVGQLEIPEDGNVGGFEMRAACAGHNYDVGGRIDHVSAAGLRVQDAIDAHMRRELSALRADEDRWNWVRCKLMLHQLESATPFEAPAC